MTKLFLLQIFVTTIFFTTSLLLSRHTHVCHDKTRLLSRWNTSFVMTNVILSRSKFCCSKHTFVAAKDVFCHDKHVFVVTKKRYLRQLQPVIPATPTSHTHQPHPPATPTSHKPLISKQCSNQTRHTVLGSPWRADGK